MKELFAVVFLLLASAALLWAGMRQVHGTGERCPDCHSYLYVAESGTWKDEAGVTHQNSFEYCPKCNYTNPKSEVKP